MAPIIKGSEEVIERKKILRWRDGHGYSSEQTFTGPEEKIVKRAKELQEEVDEFEIRTKAGYSTLIAQSGTGDSSVIVLPSTSGLNCYWEIIKEQFDKDIRTHPFLDVLGDDKAMKLEAADNAIDDGEAIDLITAGVDSVIETYIRLRLTGTDSYIAWAYTLRKTTPLANESKKKASFEGVGKVTTGDPTTGAVVIKSSRAAKKKFDIPDGEWLKCPPDVVQVGRHRYHIVEDWLRMDKWSAALYEGGTGTP